MDNRRFAGPLKRVRETLHGVEHNLSRYYRVVRDIRNREERLKSRSDSELRALFRSFSERAGQGQALDELLPGCYAVIGETVRRVLTIDAYDVQFIGSIVLHEGKLAEMETGEGKTLSAVFPACLNCLVGRVHVLTFNDYLARRDASWMGPIYHFHGIEIGCIQEGMSPDQRRRAYGADIVYLTAKEAGFDYLRDSLCLSPQERVHRVLDFAIVDEADSILIDEARVPLVIAGSRDRLAGDVHRVLRVVRQLRRNIDLEITEGDRNVTLTEVGLARAEELIHCGGLYEEDNLELLTMLNCALHAEFLLRKDVDYIVRNGRIELVDEFTGRVADRRRWPDGLQAALEAKEGLSVQSQGVILNSITLQHFLRLYPGICGMTATAAAAADELFHFYGLKVVVIPPNRRSIRRDYEDGVFRTANEKQEAVLDEIIQVTASGRPVLVGTRSVRESAALADALERRSMSCKVLNAKNDEQEAAIIAEAGRPGAVTISTNMAGRGTDILLGGSDQSERKLVDALGGLHVIGTNRHGSERIDRQLRGRAGRQGDPGSSRFFASLDDDLFRKCGLLPQDLGVNPDGEAIAARTVARCQSVVEAQDYRMRKTLYKFSSTIERQRTILFEKREEYQEAGVALEFFRQHCPETFGRFPSGNDGALDLLCRKAILHFIDTNWSDHLADVGEIREAIHLRRLGGQEPVVEFQRSAISLFDERLSRIEADAIKYLSTLKVDASSLEDMAHELKLPSATWTYLVNDDPFEDRAFTVGAQLGNLGLAVGVAVFWPVVFATKAIAKWRRRKNRAPGCNHPSE
jgi:preprotein translocase subunit SecA